jgi:hypothetical protein
MLLVKTIGYGVKEIWNFLREEIENGLCP